jgi:Zn ribbon nucleic-acid-binding protein
MLCLSLLTLLAADAPRQPIPFSHKAHAGELKLACKSCHVNPPPGEAMTFPAERTCMACHTSVKTDSAEIRKLAKFHEESKPVPWIRVYRLPTFVYWSHKSHLAAGATCETCHGPVAERTAISKEKGIAMADCMSCHRQHQASNDCSYCHEKLN